MVTEAQNEPTRETRVFPEDVLAAVLAYAIEERQDEGVGEPDEFRTYDYRLQEIFAELVDHYDFLRKYFVFSKAGPKPFSPALNDALSELQLGGLVARQNPEYQVLKLKAAGRRYVEEDLQDVLDAHFSPEELSQLRAAARDFKESVGR